jgi:hypothetical protein
VETLARGQVLQYEFFVANHLTDGGVVKSDGFSNSLQHIAMLPMSFPNGEVALSFPRSDAGRKEVGESLPCDVTLLPCYFGSIRFLLEESL